MDVIEAFCNQVVDLKQELHDLRREVVRLQDIELKYQKLLASDISMRNVLSALIAIKDY